MGKFPSKYNREQSKRRVTEQEASDIWKSDPRFLRVQKKLFQTDSFPHWWKNKRRNKKIPLPLLSSYAGPPIVAPVSHPEDKRWLIYILIGRRWTAYTSFTSRNGVCIVAYANYYAACFIFVIRHIFYNVYGWWGEIRRVLASRGITFLEDFRYRKSARNVDKSTSLTP